jgi:hypothetical protein
VTATASAATKPTDSANFTADEYSQLVDSARLFSIRLIKSEFVLEPEGLGSDRSGWKQSYDCKTTGVTFDPKRKVLAGLVSAEVACKLGKKRIIALKCRYVVGYSIDGEPSEAAARSFAERVSAFAAYPYFRSHFAECCSQGGLSLPPLPVLKEPKRRITPVAKASSATE